MLECLATEINDLDRTSQLALNNALSACAAPVLAALLSALASADGDTTAARLAAKGASAWLRLTTSSDTKSLLSIGACLLPHAEPLCG